MPYSSANSAESATERECAFCTSAEGWKHVYVMNVRPRDKPASKCTRKSPFGLLFLIVLPLELLCRRHSAINRPRRFPFRGADKAAERERWRAWEMQTYNVCVSHACLANETRTE